MQNYQAANVDEYLRVVPESVRPALEHLRQLIKAAAPEAEETISYMMPTYKYQGPLVYFAALKNHLSLYVAEKNIIKQFQEELKSFNTSGTAIHFTPEKQLPDNLIQKIVATRIRQNEEIQAAKQLAGKGKNNPKT